MARQRKKIRKGKPRHNPTPVLPTLVEIYKAVKAEFPDSDLSFVQRVTAEKYAASRS